MAVGHIRPGAGHIRLAVGHIRPAVVRIRPAVDTQRDLQQVAASEPSAARAGAAHCSAIQVESVDWSVHS